MDDKVTEQMLNAFVDDELDSEERALIFKSAEHSSETDIELCDYRKLKDLIRHAYAEVPGPRKSIAAKIYQPRKMAASRMAVIFLVLVSALIGGMVKHGIDLAGNEGPNDMAGQKAANGGVILHLRSNDPALMDDVLSRAEHLLEARANGLPVHIEVVTNEDGIDLLRSDRTPYAERISALAGKNVVFIACARRIERLKENNEEVALVTAAEDRFTVFERVVKRLQQGWQYESI